MKASKIFGLTVMVLFIGVILALGMNHILNKFVPHSLEEIPASQSLTPSKIESPKAIVDKQAKFEEKVADLRKEVPKSKKADDEDIQLIEEGSPSEVTIATAAPIPSSNITGPLVEPGKVTKELPVFAPLGSRSGPSATTSTTSDSRTANVVQNPSSVAENTEKTYQDVVAFIPSESRGGPPIDPQRTYKELPPFTPITNTTGPLKVNQ